jgi:hypothetical protein
MDLLKALIFLIAGLFVGYASIIAFDEAAIKYITVKVPSVSAQCKDGTFSTSKRDSGTCSHHGGVRLWVVR